jgi:thymidylate synthase (FAD)
LQKFNQISVFYSEKRKGYYTKICKENKRYFTNKEERMQIIKPYFEIMDEVDGEKILKRLELCSRTCYKSEDKIGEDSAGKLLLRNIESGHESVIEHEKVTVRIICDRGVTHEIVRHRIASYSQESTRYCNYKSKGIKFIDPFFFSPDGPKKLVSVPNGWMNGNREININQESDKKEINEFDVWFMAMLISEWAYNTLVTDFGRTPQEARSVLPNSLKTEIVITYDLREWRHFFKLRTSAAAHPQMREITIPLLQKFKEMIPVIFDDINIS